jgi:hypothetical protein
MILRTIKNEQELQRFQDYMVTVYGDDQEPYEVTHQWWRNYSDGFLVLFDKNRIVGSFSILPLSYAEHEKLCASTIRERELTTRVLSNKICKYWHLSNIHLTEYLRDSGYIKTFMEQVSAHLQGTGNFPHEISVTALIFSEDGRKFFERLNFEKVKDAKETPDHMPLYTTTLKEPFFT